MKNNMNERDWQRKYAETFYDAYAYHEIATFGKVTSQPMNLLDYAYQCAKENHKGNESVNPETLAKSHIKQITEKSKEVKNV